MKTDTALEIDKKLTQQELVPISEIPKAIPLFIMYNN